MDKYASLRAELERNSIGINTLFDGSHSIFDARTIRELLTDHDQWRQQARYETDVAQAACERVKEVEVDRDRLRDVLQSIIEPGWLSDALQSGSTTRLAKEIVDMKRRARAALAQEQS